MSCIIKYKNFSITEDSFLKYLDKIITVNKLFEENPQFSSEIYEALGFQGSISLESNLKNTGKTEKELIDYLKQKYPEIKLDISNNPIWEKENINIFNQLIQDDYFEGNTFKYQNEIEKVSNLILNKLKFKLKKFNGKYDESITSLEDYKSKVLNDLLKEIGITGAIFNLEDLKNRLNSPELQKSLIENLNQVKESKENYRKQLESFYSTRRLLNNFLKHFDINKYDAQQQLIIKSNLPSLFKENKFKSDKQAIAFSKRQINSTEWANKKFQLDKISIFFLGQNAKISKIETLINYFKIDKQDAVERIYTVVENELNRREKFFTSEKIQSKVNAKITEDKIKADNEKAERLRRQNEELNKYKNSTVVQEVEGFLGSRNIHDLEDVLESSNINVELAIIKNNGFDLDKTPDGKESNLFKSILNLPEVNGNVEVAKKLKSLVYSKDFTIWFGDWLNNPEESSKIVDENGEPKLVYHGSGREFSNFEEKERGSTTGKWKDRLSDSEMSFMFTDSPTTAFYYAIIERQQILKEITYYIRKSAQEPTNQIIQEMYQKYPAIKNWVEGLKQKGLTRDEILKEFNRVYQEYNKIRDLSEGGAIGNQEANNQNTKQIIDYLEKNKESILKKGIPKNDKYNTAIIPNSDKNGYPIWLWSSKEYNTVSINNNGVLNSFTTKFLNGKNIKELSSSEYDLMVEEFKNNFIYNYEKIQDEIKAGGFRPKVYPVFLNAKNINQKDFKGRPFVFQQGDTEDIVSKRQSKGAAFEVADLIEEAVNNNLDGSVIENIADPTVSTNYAVFKSNQVKSIFNKKDYSSQDSFYNQISNNKIIGQANIKAMTVLVDAVNKKEDTIPHEYAHHYIAWFRNTPIVQEAIKRFGSEEALVQAIGEQVVKQKGEAYNWWKKFTNWILNLLSDKQLLQVLTDSFLNRQDLHDFTYNQPNTQQKQQAQQLYSQYLDTIFPDSKVRDIVYRGSQKEDTRLFQYWTKNETEAYMYAKANITKGGKITERNPIQVITNNFKKYIDDKYGENVFNSLNADESDYLTQISETEFDLQLPDWYRKNIKLDSEDESDFKSLQTLKELYDSIKIEDEDDLDKPYTVDNYVALKKKYDLARKQLDKYFKREEVGKIKTAILNIKNPYKEEIVQEDLQNDRDAYKNGHDGAFLMDGDHFFVKSNTEQIHILGNKQDIENFTKFVNNKKEPLQLNPDIVKQDILDTLSELDVVSLLQENNIVPITKEGKIQYKINNKIESIYDNIPSSIVLYSILNNDTSILDLFKVETKEKVKNPIENKIEISKSILYSNKNLLETDLDILNERLKELEYNNISYKLTKNENGTYNVNYFYESETSSEEDVDLLVNKLKKVFPQLKVAIIDEKNMSDFLDRSKLTEETWNSIPSFVIGDTVYLVKGRYTSANTIEELLHPFVNSLYLDNNELFNSLYEEALSKYPELYDQIRSTYNGVYDVEDIKKEFLTQVLQQEYQQPKYSILSKFLNWLKGIISKLTDKPINVKNLKNLSLSQITMLMYDDNARIFMDSFENKPFYHIDDVLKSKIDTILTRNGVAKGSPQYNVVETILKNQVVTFTEDNHTYQDENGELYNSVTTIVKGKLDEQDPDYLKYKINRDWGTQLDYIAEQILLGLEIDKSKVKDLPDNIINDFINQFDGFIAGITMEGGIVLPQIVLNSKEDKVAGKPDYLIISKSGAIQVLDLKVSKNSAFSNSHENTTYSTKLVDENNNPIRLSTRGQHTVQVTSYAKMIENYGLPVEKMRTLHFKVDVKDSLNDKKEVVKQELLSISREGIIDHNKVEYIDERMLVEKVVQTIQTEQAEDDTAKREQRKIESGRNLLDKLNKLISDWEITLSTKVIKSQNFRTYVAELSQFLDILKEESDPEVIYTELLQFYNEKLAIRNESIQKMLDNNEEITVNKLNIFKHYAEESAFIKSLLQQTELLVSNPYINTLALNLNESLEDFLDNYDIFREKHLKQALENNLQREYTDKEINQLLNEAMPTSNDISTMSTWARRMVESGDAFLTLVDTLVKNQLQNVKDLMKTFQENVAKFANAVYLNHSGKKGEEFHYMLSKNKKGEITGHLVDNLDWYAYKETQDEYYKNCFDANGQLRGLEEVDSSLTQAEQDEIKKRNIDLWLARKKKREFDQEERVINGMIEDGEFHKYTQEFKDARDLLFKPYINPKYDSISWVKKDTTTKKQLTAFYNRYYTTPVEYKAMIMEKGKPTGEIEYKEQRFPKKEFIEKVTTVENGLLNKKYVEIMSWENSSNKEQKAKYDFYMYYTTQMKELIKLIPEKQAHKLNGQIAKVKQRLMTEATVTMKGGWFNVFVDSIKSFFSLKSEASSVMVYSDNEIDQETLPILFVADFKSENLINYLKYKKDFINLSFSKKPKDFIIQSLTEKGATEKQIKSLFDLKLDLNEYKTFKFELAKVNKAIYLEESKISAGELETDLAKNLTVFAKMVYGYDAMNSIEGTIQLVKDKIKNKKYTVESSIGDKLKGKNSKEDAFVTGENSNVYKRLDSYLKMTYYKTARPFDSKIGQFAKKMLSTMAVRSVGLNPFGQFSNALIGKISNFIESNPFGKTGLYWNKSHIIEADKEHTKSLIDFSNELEQGPYKLSHLKTNKYDAIVEFFNMDRGYTPAGTYGQFSVKDQLTEKAFYMQQKVEYALQTKTGVSILMAKKIINSITGKESSIYNAMEFNKKEGKVQFKEGFSLDKNDKHALTNFIYEVNSAIHGNYAVEDKMPIQASLLGELVSVYRKHIVPGYDQRFRKAYFNDVRGWQEGRYVTVQQFFLTLLKLKDLRYTWDSLSDTQKINMQKNLTELGFIIATAVITGLLAAGADDDDSKLYNAFRVSIDKLNSEMLFYYPIVGIKQQAQFLKNPSAVLSYAGDIGDLFTAGIKTGMGDPYFKTGINKGELRLTKEAMDVIPGLQMINKWQSYETVKSFYIK